MHKYTVSDVQNTKEYVALANHVRGMREDYVRFYEYKNLAAGRRLRKKIRPIIKLMQLQLKQILHLEKKWEKELDVSEG